MVWCVVWGVTDMDMWQACDGAMLQHTEHCLILGQDWQG